MPPPPGRQEAAPGDQRPPPTPPPPSHSGPWADGGRPKKRRPRTPPPRGHCTRGAGAPQPRQAPARPARCRPTADRRRPGRRKRSGPIRGRPGEDRGANQGRGVPPPPSPPPLRRTDPLAADRTAPDARGRPATPTARVYLGGARRRQQMAGRRPTGRGGRGAAPPSPPPRPPPPVWEPQERPSAPPEPRGCPPLPEGTVTRGGGGGVRLDLHTARPSAPSRLHPRGSRPQGEPTPACRSNACTKLWGGARRRTSMEAAPYMTLP